MVHPSHVASSQPGVGLAAAELALLGVTRLVAVRVLGALLAALGISERAVLVTEEERLRGCLISLHRYVRAVRQGKGLEPKRRAGGARRRMGDGEEKVIRSFLASHPQATVDELREHLANETGAPTGSVPGAVEIRVFRQIYAQLPDRRYRGVAVSRSSDGRRARGARRRYGATSKQ